jgi:E3 ubiquitin-protein ligase synoviolin
MSFAIFYERLVSLIRYLKLSGNLEQLDDATPEELAGEENCLICREGLEHGKKLPCKHIYHLDCLRVWLQHKQTCPLCRLVNIPSAGNQL